MSYQEEIEYNEYLDLQQMQYELQPYDFKCRFCKKEESGTAKYLTETIGWVTGTFGECCRSCAAKSIEQRIQQTADTEQLIRNCTRRPDTTPRVSAFDRTPAGTLAHYQNMVTESQKAAA